MRLISIFKKRQNIRKGTTNNDVVVSHPSKKDTNVQINNI